ncbi:MAG: GntR family transcriptional regulator, transcriptional repressor for pyruvate dehydrogenase complex [Pseudonocardiales bacterium]|nr:GntR family transcriptional regulator, transcriptional repressor for pyruvate dehydrogenase complex [Pseudonocardiales bacterium]
MGRLSDQVVADLRRAIVHNEYQPGGRLPTADTLSETLGVSRSVVRDALRTLSSMGLVEVRHGHGIFVAQPRDDVLTNALALRMQRSELTVGDVLDARVALESALAAEAARTGGPDSFALMHGHLSGFEQAVRDADWPTANREHLDFHLGIIKALRLPALEMVIEPLQEYIIVSSIPTEPESQERWGLGSHDAIMAALNAGDPDAARTAILDHFAYTRSQRYAEHVKRSFREARTAVAEHLREPR